MLYSIEAFQLAFIFPEIIENTKKTKASIEIFVSLCPRSNDAILKVQYKKEICALHVTDFLLNIPGNYQLCTMDFRF